MADTDTILAATVVYLHAWEELCRNGLIETFLIDAAITQVGGLTVLTKGVLKVLPWNPMIYYTGSVFITAVSH